MTVEDEPFPIVLIHGLWITRTSWAPWVERYRQQGHDAVAQPWPEMERSVDELRRDSSGITGLTVERVLDHFSALVSAMPQPPLLIGHSFGGALVQLLLDRGLGRAGVALCSAGVRGVYGIRLSQLKVMGPILANPANRKRAIPVTVEGFHAGAANALTAEQAAVAHAEHIVPAPGRLVFGMAAMNLPRSPFAVDLHKRGRAPLLFVAGSADRMAPPSFVRENARKQAKAGAVTGYIEYPGRSHFIGQPGWEVVADEVLKWARQPSSVGLP